MSTTRLDVHEAETHLSAHVDALEPGDRIILYRRDRPVAEIRPLDASPNVPRPIGLGRGLAEIPDSFFDPLPEDLNDLFGGSEPGARDR